MSVIASDRSNSAYSFDDSGSGVSHISEEIFQQKTMGECEFKAPLDLDELYLKIQARVPSKCVEVIQTLRSYYTNSQLVDIMLDKKKLLSVINDILEDLTDGSSKLSDVERTMRPRSPRTVNSEPYRVCNPLNTPISSTPVQNVTKISSIPMPLGQQNHFNFQPQPQPNVQNPVYYRPQQRPQQQQQQPVYRVVYPQYYYVAQPQIQTQYMYRTQPAYTNQGFQLGNNYRYC